MLIDESAYAAHICEEVEMILPAADVPFHNVDYIFFGHDAIGVAVNKEDLEFLAHYGVKGMHWGVRKDRYSVGSGTTFQPSTKYSGKNLSVDEIFQKVVLGDGVSPINPKYGARGTKMNCRRCTFAYEMRRRGYDVKATRAKKGLNIVHLMDAVDQNPNQYDSAPRKILKQVIRESRHKVNDEKSLSYILRNRPFGLESVDLKPSEKHVGEGIYRMIKAQPKGSRGEVCIQWKFGGAHSLAYENIDGKPTLFDTQSGELLKGDRKFEDVAVNFARAGITRLDNIPLNVNVLQDWLE